MGWFGNQVEEQGARYGAVYTFRKSYEYVSKRTDGKKSILMAIITVVACIFGYLSHLLPISVAFPQAADSLQILFAYFRMKKTFGLAQNTYDGLGENTKLTQQARDHAQVAAEASQRIEEHAVRIATQHAEFAEQLAQKVDARFDAMMARLDAMEGGSR